MKQKSRAMLLIGFGMALILTAACLFTLYEWEAEAAGENARQLLASLNQQIQQNQEQAMYDSATQEQTTGQMLRTTLQGYDLVGVIRIPAVQMELPVLNDWSYELLKLSPCRYSGSVEGQDLILLGHNYKKHFAPLKRVEAGDLVEFQDVGGAVHRYTVSETQILKPTQLDELTAAADHALTLFTCTTGGQSRFVVRCVPAQ